MNKISRFLLIAVVLLLIAISAVYLSKTETIADATPDAHNDSQQASEQPVVKDNSNSAQGALPDETTQPEQLDDIDQEYNPAIWKVEHNGVTSYLFGSIHMGDQSMYPLPEPIRTAFSESEILVVEIDMTNINQMEVAQTVQKIAINPDKPLKDHLTESTAQKYDEYCEETRSPCQMFSSFEPWFAAMTLEALAMQQSGYTEQLGIDMHFLNEAKNSKTIVELESLDSQLNMLDSMPAHLQDLMLLSTVTREEGATELMVQAWKTGDVESFLSESAMSAKDQGISEEDYEAFMDLFLYERNQGMADGIAELLEQGKSVFAVVGAAHYGGDKSVNYYLEQKGFTVTRM